MSDVINQTETVVPNCNNNDSEINMGKIQCNITVN